MYFTSTLAISVPPPRQVKLSRAYEYLLRMFAEASGSKAGEFLTPGRWSG